MRAEPRSSDCRPWPATDAPDKGSGPTRLGWGRLQHMSGCVVGCSPLDDGGPGFDLAEVALYWLGPRVLDVSPASLSFGLIGIGEASVRSFTISNVGSEPVTVTVPGSPFPSSFGWTGVPATVLPPGGSLPPLTVEFSPLASSDGASSPAPPNRDGTPGRSQGRNGWTAGGVLSGDGITRRWQP